jgi:hypothetical protein
MDRDVRTERFIQVESLKLIGSILFVLFVLVDLTSLSGVVVFYSFSGVE